jgi:lipoprotein NlpI
MRHTVDFVEGDLMSHTKWGFAGVFGVFTVAVLCSSLPASAKDDCHDLKGDAGIAACTRNIDSGKYKGHERAIDFYNRGLKYRRDKGNPDRAIIDYNTAIGIDPKYSDAYNNRGFAYAEKRDYDHAIADYNQAIRLNPKDPFPFNNRAIAYRNKGNLDQALADSNAAISLSPTTARYYYGRGITYRRKGDLDRAIADYSQAISIDPKYGDAFYNRGLAYRNKGDNDRALADFNQALSIDPKDGDVYKSRGRVNLYAGALPKALADFNQASALDPKDAYAALWVEIAGQRNNLPSRLTQASSQLDMTEWPAPIIGLFLGQMTPAAVLAAADDANATRKKEKACEANFFSGELSLMKGGNAEAIRLFHSAASDCPDSSPESYAATAELKALGAAP